jgi:hypothetical protein
MFKRLLNNGRSLILKENTSILSAATIIMGASLASALLGLIRTRLLITYFYNDTAILDVFWAAFRLPDMVFQIIIVGALSSAFIPVFSKYLGNNGQSNRLASSMINAVMITMLLLTILLIIYARPLSGLIAGGFDDAQLDLMANITRIMAAAQLFFGFSSFYRHYPVPSAIFDPCALTHPIQPWDYYWYCRSGSYSGYLRAGTGGCIGGDPPSNCSVATRLQTRFSLHPHHYAQHSCRPGDD